MSVESNLERNAEAERQLTHDADELEHRIGRIDDHLEDAKAELKDRRADAQPTDEVAGEWEGESGGANQGEDAEDAGFDDPEAEDDDEDEE
jgi:hypothetical protein